MLKVEYSKELKEGAEACLLRAFEEGSSMACPPSYVVDSALMVIQGVGFYQEDSLTLPITTPNEEDDEL